MSSIVVISSCNYRDFNNNAITASAGESRATALSSAIVVKRKGPAVPGQLDHQPGRDDDWPPPVSRRCGTSRSNKNKRNRTRRDRSLKGTD